MNVRRWYYENKNRYEEFEVLYDNGRFMLVRNVEGGAFSFGLCEDFGTPFGFPACWSCLTKDQIVEKLNGFIGIDKQYRELEKFAKQQYGYTGAEQWQAMIDAALRVVELEARP